MTRSNYRIGIGHDLNFASLQPFNPQPRSGGVKYTRVTYLGGGIPYREGAYIELLWNVLDDETVYFNIITLAGVQSSLYMDVTLYARSDQWTYGRFNGTANMPIMGVDANWEYFPRDIVLLIKNLKRIG